LAEFPERYLRREELLPVFRAVAYLDDDQRGSTSNQKDVPDCHSSTGRAVKRGEDDSQQRSGRPQSPDPTAESVPRTPAAPKTVDGHRFQICEALG
jgi:hypothetical protein